MSNKIELNILEAQRDLKFEISVNNVSKKFVISMPDWFRFTNRQLIFYAPLSILVNLLALGGNTDLYIDEINGKTRSYWARAVDLSYKDACILLKKDLEKPIINWHFKEAGDLKLGKSGQDSKLQGEGKNVVCSMSGGLDSLLSFSLLENIGFKPLPVTVRWSNIASSQGLNNYLKNYFKTVRIEPETAFTNINRQADLFLALNNIKFDNIQKTKDESQNSQFFLLYVTSIHMVQNVVMIWIADFLNIKHVITGDNWDDNMFWETYKNQFVPSIGALGENIVWHKIITQINRLNNSDVEVGSLLYPIRSISELYLLTTLYPDKAKIFSSCITQINKWCCKCDKCLKTWFLFKILDLEPKEFGFDENKLFKRHYFFKKRQLLPDSKFYLDNDEITEYTNLLSLEKEQRLDEILSYDQELSLWIPDVFRKKVNNLYQDNLNNSNNTNKNLVMEVEKLWRI